MSEPPTLYVVACGCPLTRHVPDVLAAATAAGWQNFVIATPDGMGWLPLDQPEDPAAPRVSAVPVFSTHRSPDQPKRQPLPDAVVVLATANTVAKMRAGIADTYAHAVLAEAISLRVPLVVVPSISSRLGGHPAYREAIDWLRSIGTVVVDPQNSSTQDWKPIDSDAGEALMAKLDWAEILGWLNG